MHEAGLPHLWPVCLLSIYKGLQKGQEKYVVGVWGTMHGFHLWGSRVYQNKHLLVPFFPGVFSVSLMNTVPLAIPLPIPTHRGVTKLRDVKCRNAVSELVGRVTPRYLTGHVCALVVISLRR